MDRFKKVKLLKNFAAGKASIADLEAKKLLMVPGGEEGTEFYINDKIVTESEYRTEEEVQKTLGWNGRYKVLIPGEDDGNIMLPSAKGNTKPAPKKK
jgi:hypothetical protein